MAMDFEGLFDVLEPTLPQGISDEQLQPHSTLGGGTFQPQIPMQVNPNPAMGGGGSTTLPTPFNKYTPAVTSMAQGPQQPMGNPSAAQVLQGMLDAVPQQGTGTIPAMDSFVPALDDRNAIGQELGNMSSAVPQQGTGTIPAMDIANPTMSDNGNIRPLTSAEEERRQEVLRGISTGVAPQEAKPQLSAYGQATVEELGGGFQKAAPLSMQGEAGKAAEALVRQGEMESRVKRAGDRNSAKASLKALEGILDAPTIKKQMEAMAIEAGGTLEKLSPRGQAQFLNRIRVREQKKAVADKKTQRQRAATSQKSRYNDDGTPANKYAVAQDVDNWGIDTPDPANPEKSNYDGLSKGHKAEMKRYTDAAARGADTPGMRSRAATIMAIQNKKTVRKQEVYERDKANRAEALRVSTALNSEDRTAAMKFEQEYERKQDEYSRADDKVARLERSGRPSNNTAGLAYDKRLREATGDAQKASDAIGEFLKRGAEAAVPKPDDSGLIVGKEYPDADGNIAVYKGNGKWDEK